MKLWTSWTWVLCPWHSSPYILGLKRLCIKVDRHLAMVFVHPVFLFTRVLEFELSAFDNVPSQFTHQLIVEFIEFHRLIHQARRLLRSVVKMGREFVWDTSVCCPYHSLDGLLLMMDLQLEQSCLFIQFGLLQTHGHTNISIRIVNPLLCNYCWTCIQHHIGLDPFEPFFHRDVHGALDAGAA